MQTIQIGLITTTINCKLIITKNVSSIFPNNLTEGQKSILAKGPNFSIMPKYIPNMDYITAVKFICSKLKEEDAMDLWLDINALLRKVKALKPNLTRQESIGLVLCMAMWD